MGNESPQYCSFCGKAREEVKHLIVGPKVFICDECVDLCRRIIVPTPEDKPITFLVRGPCRALESWCRELIGEPRRPRGDEPRWNIQPIEGQSRSPVADHVATWKVVIPATFGGIFKMSWPRASEAPP